MISAVDTNVLLDVLNGDPEFGPGSMAILRRAASEGRLVACAAVWAEVVAAFGDEHDASAALDRMTVELVADDRAVAAAAGSAWRAYRRAGGTRRRRNQSRRPVAPAICLPDTGAMGASPRHVIHSLEAPALDGLAVAAILP